MSPVSEYIRTANRRRVLKSGVVGIGTAALSSVLQRDVAGAAGDSLAQFPHFAPKAKRVIHLCQSGAPSQLDLYDWKPQLARRRGMELPDSVRGGQRFTGMTKDQASFPVAPTIFQFRQHGESGAWLSELLPHTSKVADELCFVKTLHTDAINHDPAITFIQTGSSLAGRPSMGSWLAYGLGSMNEDLPTFVAMTSGDGGQPLYDRLWGSGFLPTVHSAVKFRRTGDPVLYLSNPAGISSQLRREMLNDLAKLNEIQLWQQGDPEIAARMTQYEMAARMQSSVPDLVDVSDEPEHILELYGSDCRKPGTYASNCLLARRLAERGVRFVQLYHRGWDHHGNLPDKINKQCRQTDQAGSALVQDLRARGMLEDTLVVWSGEFGRTVYCQGALNEKNYGRDHHPRCFTIWMAGGGVNRGTTYGETDDFSYNIAKDGVEVHDLNATIMHLMGIEHTRLTYQYQGRHHRLTDVHGNVLPQLLG
ncbi:MAG: DUF1501 domain-containing protein [Fuerstiella sp.]|nr:DUF1501 domain-containing protein [Fuerstiella sp.]